MRAGAVKCCRFNCLWVRLDNIAIQFPFNLLGQAVALEERREGENVVGERKRYANAEAGDVLCTLTGRATPAEAVGIAWDGPVADGVDQHALLLALVGVDLDAAIADLDASVASCTAPSTIANWGANR